MSDAKGEWISCASCAGHGVVSVYSAADFEGPGECRDCNAGRVWRYASGALAMYPGGPFCGNDRVGADAARKGE